MSERHAHIEVTWHEVPYGRRYPTLKWVGRPGDPAYIREDYYDGFVLPWPVKLLEYDHSMAGGLYVRTDVRWWWITYIRAKMVEAWRWVYYRLLATCKIWGLAKYDPYRYPSWRDIRPVAWVLRRWKR